MSARQYIEHAYFSYLLSAQFDKRFADRWLPREEISQIFRDAFTTALKPYGYTPSTKYDDIIDTAAAEVEANAIQVEGDEFTGEFCLFTVTKKDTAIQKLLKGNPVEARLSALGSSARERAFREVARREGWTFDSNDYEQLEASIAADDQAPASDRVVTFSDNQVSEFEQSATEVIEAVSAQNQLGGEAGLREIVLGQLKAGRELIRAGSFKLYFLQITLIDTLQFLAKRYEKEAIGALASALAAALLSQLGLAS